MYYLRLHFYDSIDSLKLKTYYDGNSDVRMFITKVELEASLKNHADEKKAQYVASRLVGPAMGVYLRMTAEDKKDVEKIKTELLKEFERGQLNRDEAIAELDQRKRLTGESTETFAYKIIELVKLSYPGFDADVRGKLAKDYFVRGLQNNMQLALKSNKDYESSDLKTSTAETVRLELAGVGSRKVISTPINFSEMENADFVNSIADKVLEKMKDLRSSDNEYQIEVNMVSPNRYREGSNRYRSNNRKRGRFNQNRTTTRRCRSCQSPDHLIKDCPTRFCQACGGRGHDQYNQTCPNFQP